MLCLLIEETIDSEDAVNKQRIEDVLNRIGNEELKEILREMLKLAPWERPSMDEVLNRLLKVYQKLITVLGILSISQIRHFNFSYFFS